jgi:hypothetical protein
MPKGLNLYIREYQAGGRVPKHKEVNQTHEKILSRLKEVSDKGVGPNRVWYKLTKYVKPQKEAKTNDN